jgi:hypothetical protein
LPKAENVDAFGNCSIFEKLRGIILGFFIKKKWVNLGLLRVFENFGDKEVGNEDFEVLGKEDIGRGEISEHNIVVVEFSDKTKGLIKNSLF